MNLKCLIDHIYQEQTFKAGEVYELDDALALEFLRDFGPGEATGIGSVETRRGRPAKFEATTERPTDSSKPEPDPDAPVIDNTLPPEGEGTPAAEGAARSQDPGADVASKEEGNGLCNYPVGSGTCVLAEGHAGAHRLTQPDEVRR